MLLQTFLCASLLGVASPSEAPAQPVAEAWAIRAAHILVDGKTTIDDGLVFIQGSTIVAVGPAASTNVPDGVQVVEHAGYLSAGLIACHSYSGVFGDNHDETRTLIGEARVLESVRSQHSDMSDLRAAGVTTFVVAPSTSNVVGGQTAVIKSNGEVLRERGHLAISLSSNALSTRREPTSAGGAVRALEEALQSGEGVYGDVADLQLPVLIDVHDRHETMRAIQLCKRFKIGGALYRAPLAGELTEHLLTGRLGVIAEPFSPGQAEREVLALVKLIKSGVVVGFGLDAPAYHAETMRLSAAMCVRAGLSPEAAWEALTVNASRIAGVTKRTGRVAPELDADLLLWSGHPLDLGSKLEAVYISGEAVETAKDGAQ